MKNVEDMSLEELAEFQAKNREKMDAQKKKVQERKKRNHALIVIGAEITSLGVIPDYLQMKDDELRKSVYDLIM